MTAWPLYFMRIVVHPYRFEVLPKGGTLPQVIATTEKLVVAADWGDNIDPTVGNAPKWRRIVIRDFRLVNPPKGLGNYVLPPQQGIERDEYNSKEFKFNAYSSALPPLVVAFDIDFVLDADPTVAYTLDPVIIIRPDPGYGSMTQG